MKNLTVKQPFADAILSGIKDIENRSWLTNYRGKIYIHSSQSKATKKDLYYWRLSSN